MAYFLPLPAVLSAVRGGPAAGRKTVTATTVLLLGASAHRTDSLGVGIYICRQGRVQGSLTYRVSVPHSA